MQEMCFGCDILWLRDILIVLTLLLTLFFNLPVMLLCWVQVNNYRTNKTSNERFARSARTASTDEDDLNNAEAE